MSDLGGFWRLGLQHILSPSALDHLLFLLVLAAPHRPADWRRVLILATGFTLGHSLTLAVVVSGLVRAPTALIEFLIPLTIVWAGLDNLLRREDRPRGWVAPALATAFGLIHGAGFAGFLQALFSGPVVGPLLAFNLGIEAGQLAVLASALLLFAAIDRTVLPRPARLTVRPTTAVVSAAAAAWAAALAFQRTPW